MKRLDVGFTALLMVIAVGVLWLSWDWPFRSRMFVHAVAAPFVALTAVQLVVGLRRLREKGSSVGRGMDLRLGGNLPPAVVARRGLAFTGWLVGFGVVLWLLGFVVGGLLMVVLVMAVAMRERLLPIVVMVASLGLVLFLLRTVLNIPLPSGALLRMLGM